MILEPLPLALEAARALEARGALDLTILDMQHVTSICDYFIICHGRAEVHCQALAEHTEEHLEGLGRKVAHQEGMREGSWIILDYLHIVVHIFTEETRNFYDLQRLWEGAEEVPLPDFA